MSAVSGEFQRNWKVVLAAGAGVGVGLTGLPFYTFGVFIKPLSEDMGWSRAAISTGMLCLNSAVVLTGPFIGSLIDRRGVRTVALLSLVGLAIGFGLLSISGPGVATFYMAWLALAFLGCGTTPLTWTRAITLNFDKRRGLALGLALLGTGIASLIGPPLVQKLIAAYGWQGGYRGMGLFVLLCVVPIVYFGIGSGKSPAQSARASAAPLVGLAYGQAMRSGRFWTIACGIFLVILGQAGFTVHLIPLLGDRGIAPGQAAGVAGLLGLSVIVGRVLVGLLLDRFHAPKVARIFLALPALALAVLHVRADLPSAYFAAALLGLAAGAEVDLLSYLISRYFGLRSYGAIYGTALSLFGLGAGLGPILTGLAFDSFGSYDPALLAGIFAFLAGAGLIGMLGRYPDFSTPNGAR
ncbi:MFS transporter [soil metagenome]